MADKPKKVKDIDLEAITALNLSGKGWSIGDIAGSVPAPTTFQPTSPLGAGAQTNMTSPAEKQTIQKMLENPDEVLAAQGPVEATKGFIANLFDYSDEQDNPVEWAWDGLWRGVGWTYDRVNQGASWAVSAAPGGIPTFTWDQAGQVSFAQAAMAAGAAESNSGNDLQSNLSVAFTGNVARLGQILGYYDMAGPLGDKDFNVLDAEMRKAAFEDSTVGKWASGLSDATFSVVADPLLFAGKFAKLAKLKYLDDTFQGEKGVERLRAQFVESAAKPFEEKAPIAQFAELSARVADDGTKLVPQEVLAQRLRGVTGQEMLVSALYANQDPRTAELIVRYAFNDIEAGKELLAVRPAIAMAMMRKQRQRITKILERNPGRKTQMAGIAQNATRKLDDQLGTLQFGSDEYRRVLAARNQAQETYNAIMDGTLGQLDAAAAAASPEVEALMVREFKDLVAYDKALAKFIDDETMRGGARAGVNSQAFAGATKGFARDNAIGRAVESSRMRRSRAAVEAAASRGAMVGTGEMIRTADGSLVEKMRRVKPWESSEYKDANGNVLVRMWHWAGRGPRWLGEQNPSGLVMTKGAAALGSWKEIQAVLNDVPIYSGGARKVQVEQLIDKDGQQIKQLVDVEIGGRARRDQILRVYMDAVDDTAAGAEAAQLALNRVEEMIFNDIAMWHGIPKKAADEIRAKAIRGRDQVVNGLRRQQDEAFWIDENGVKNKAPWLESQLQNGTYMLNYRAFNRLARLHTESGAIRMLDDVAQFGGAKAKYAYDLFNEMWRPAVLLRLGYTQRNVAEGLFRASAYAFSLDPLRNAVATGGFGVRNAFVKYNLRRSQDKAVVAAQRRAMGQSTPLPEKFTSWWEKQVQAQDTAILQLEEKINIIGREVADTTPEIKKFMYDFYSGRLERLMTARQEAIKSGVRRDELTEIDDMIKATRDDVIETSKISVFSGQTPDAARTLSELEFHNILLGDQLQRRAALDNEITAVSLFKQQGAAKRRVHDDVIEMPDGTLLSAAFNPESGYSGIALSNLSSDGTTRAVSMSSADLMESGIKAYRMKYYTSVQFGDENYFDGWANALRQMKFSEIGQMAIDGKNVDEIAAFLMNDREGRQILEWIISGENRLIRQKSKWETSDLYQPNRDGAQMVAANVVSRYEQLVPDEGLRAFLRGTYVDENFNGDVVKNFILDANGKPKYELKPIVGHIAEEVGMKTFRQKINDFTGFGMKWLGTIPEDAFVRAPFYGMRYETVLRQMADNLQAQIGPDSKITMPEYSAMMRSAHRRALKDTKEYLYTIERRTNLGTYGEVFVPFISAMQNSVTAVGKLVWNDPSVGVLMAQIYSAPSRMDLVDENGDIYLPIPKALIPDGVEEALGLTNQRGVKFSFTQLNLVGAQFEEGTLFRFGPVVAVPVGEMMNRGFLINPDAPAPLSALLGDENANTVWQLMKDYTFGKDQGAPPNSVMSLLPPSGQRLLQLWQKTDNASYARMYNTFLHAETLKTRAGLRDDYPTREELTRMTDNMTMIKLLANVGAAFPPQYESTLQVVTDEYRRIQKEVETTFTGTAQSKINETDRRFAELYGETLLIAKDLGMTKGYAPANEGMVATANKYDRLINQISSDLGDAGDLTVLSMLFSDNPNALFDQSIYSWQLNNEISGTFEAWRQRLTPEEAMTADAKNAGWTKALLFMEQLDARLAAMGLKSYDHAPGLKAEKDAFITQMADDPLFSAWFRDWKEFGSSRTNSTILMMQQALQDETFMADHASSPVWQTAGQYLQGRAQVLDALRQAGGGIEAQKNWQIKQWWDNFRADLKTQTPDWGPFANRFLDGDDNPEQPGVSFGQIMVGGR